LTLIGKGGFGKVYLAQKLDTGHVYAIKALRKDFLMKTNSVDSSRFERDVLLKVKHPFVVKLRYSFQTAGRWYLVMDFCRGGQLLTHMRNDTVFTEDRTRFYAAELVLALDCLHSVGIVHRDLKPENVLLDAAGHVLLTDFGFARVMAPDERSLSFCGTVAYMAPEIIKGEEGGGHGREVDWWSLGALCWDMLMGSASLCLTRMLTHARTHAHSSPPFTGKNEHAVKESILTHRLKFPHYFQAATTALLKGLLQRDIARRLTNEQIRAHAYFKSIKWPAVLARQVCGTSCVLCCHHDAMFARRCHRRSYQR
jgi:p70 ribosomal S6 kinase